MRRSWAVSLSCLLVSILFSTLGFAAVSDRVGSINSSQNVPLANHIAAQVQPEYDQGPVEDSYPLTVTMLFSKTATQQQALLALLAQQQNPATPQYHKWLTPEQYGERFGLSTNDLNKISSWLESQGFTVRYTARGRDFISFTGDAGLVRSTFKTEIHSYLVGGKTHFANSTAPMIPAALSGVVAGFRGLHNFFPHPMLRKHPDYTLTGASTHFLAPGDIAAIYGIQALYDTTPTAINGTGQKMVVVGQTGLYLDSLNDFFSDFGLTSNVISGCTTSGADDLISACSSTTFQYVVPGDGSTNPAVSAGDLGESDLDIEWSTSVARGAQIIFVTSSQGVDDSATWAVDQNLAPVISESYGLCESLNTAPTVTTQDALYSKAAGLGIAYFAASGDGAAAVCDGNIGTSGAAQYGLSVSYPASSVYVTAVGGTEFNEGSGSYWFASNSTNGFSAKGYIPELAWNDSTFVGSPDGTGGGPSNCVNFSRTTVTTIDGQPTNINVCDATGGGFAKPSYQTGVTPADSSRDVPDIAFSASNVNDPYIVCTSQSETTGSAATSTCAGGINSALETYNSAFGGTSASTPVAAGVTVLLNQLLTSEGLGTAGPLNTHLYTVMYANHLADFHDITTGSDPSTENNSNNVVACSPGTPSYEPTNIQCPAGASFGYSAGAGYDLTTGLGSLVVNNFINDWAASLSSFSLSATPSSENVVAGHSVSSTITLTPVNGFNQAVTYSCSGTGVTCTFNPSGATSSTTVTATIQTTANMATGAAAVTITGTAGSASKTTTVNLTVAATDQSFTLSSNVNSLTLAQGQNGTVNFTITPNATTGFNGTLTFSGASCSGLPSESTCAFSPQSVPVSGTATASVTLQITTTAPVSELRSPLGRHSGIFYAALLPGLFGILFTAGSRTRASRSLRLLGLVVVLGCSTLWLGACGGGNSNNSSQSNPGTPVGTSSVVVTASTGGSNAISQTETIMLNVTAQ